MLEQFVKLLESIVDAEGVYPHQAMWLGGDNKLTLESLDLREPLQVVDRMLRKVISGQAKELVFALDRYTKPNQGVSTKDILTVCYWKDGNWKYGVIEYQYSPKIFKEINWNIPFWNDIMEEEIQKIMAVLTNRFGKEGKKYAKVEPSVN